MNINALWTTLSNELRMRPLWMNILWFFCIYMTFVYLPYDLFFKPIADDREIWFGITLTGWYAKATEPLHWLIYGFGAWGFWKMSRWMHPWAAIYTLQIAVSMFVWNAINFHEGWITGLVSATLFLVPCVALLWQRHEFSGRTSS